MNRFMCGVLLGDHNVKLLTDKLNVACWMLDFYIMFYIIYKCAFILFFSFIYFIYLSIIMVDWQTELPNVE